MKSFYCLMLMTIASLLSTAPILAQSTPIKLDSQVIEEDPKSYCTPILGQAVYEGAVVTVPMGHNCDGLLNYHLQREINEENLEFKREELETNAKLQLYLNTRNSW